MNSGRSRCHLLGPVAQGSFLFKKSSGNLYMKTPCFNLDLYLRVPQRRTIFLSLNMHFYASYLNLRSLRNSLSSLTKPSSRTSRTNSHTNSQRVKLHALIQKQNVTCMQNLSHQSEYKLPEIVNLMVMP